MWSPRGDLSIPLLQPLPRLSLPNPTPATPRDRPADFLFSLRQRIPRSHSHSRQSAAFQRSITWRRVTDTMSLAGPHRCARLWTRSSRDTARRTIYRASETATRDALCSSCASVCDVARSPQSGASRTTSRTPILTALSLIDPFAASLLRLRIAGNSSSTRR